MKSKENNWGYIKRSTYELGKSDIVEMLFLEDDTGAFKVGTRSFNHIKYNGKLVTDYDEIVNLL